MRIKKISPIAKLRALRYFTQIEFGKKVGLSQGTISAYESGAKFPKPYHVEKIAQFFDIDVSKLDMELNLFWTYKRRQKLSIDRQKEGRYGKTNCLNCK